MSVAIRRIVRLSLVLGLALLSQACKNNTGPDEEEEESADGRVVAVRSR